MELVIENGEINYSGVKRSSTIEWGSCHREHKIDLVHNHKNTIRSRTACHRELKK